MLEQLLSILVFCCLILAALGIGRPILRGLGVEEEDRLARVVWGISLGLIVLGLLLTGLGLFGGLYAPVIGLMTMAACLWGIGDLVHGSIRRMEQAAVPLREAPPTPADDSDGAPWAPPAHWVLYGILAAAGVACLGSLIGALAPPTAGDALRYHLELPKRFLAEHRIPHLPGHDNSTLPLLAEMWFLWALALDGGVCAQLLHWGLGILLAAATVLLATPILGRRWAWVAGAVVVLTPGVSYQMTAPLNDVALAAFCTLTLAAWWRAAVNDEGRRWFVVAGLTGGAALGTKPIALLFAAAVAVTWIWAMARQSGRRRLLLEGAAIVAVVAVGVGGVWYVRAAWHRGNPAIHLLGEGLQHGNPTVGDGAPGETLLARESSPSRDPLRLLRALWQVTVHPQRHDGRGHQLGVLFLATLPGVVVCRRLRGLGTLLAVVAAYGVLWCLLRRDLRWLYPIVPPMAVVSVWVWIALRRFPRSARVVVAALFAAMVLGYSAVGAHRSFGRWAVASGVEDREDYLFRQEPTYRAAAVVNAVPAPEHRLLSQDSRTFYFDCPVTRECVYRRQHGYEAQIAKATDLSRRLRDAGFTHLLLAETVAGAALPYETTLSRLADAQWASDAADELFMLTEYRHDEADGTVRRYRLVLLRDAAENNQSQ